MKGKNIIFLHGWASGPHVWLQQVSFFKDKYSVYTPALLGYSGRELPAGNKELKDLGVFDCMVEDICDFIVDRGLRDICLVGWSLGGMVSLKIASKMSDRISRLVLIGSAHRFIQSQDFECGISQKVVEKIYSRMDTDFKSTLEWFYSFCFSSHERSRNESNNIIKLLGDLISPLDKDVLLAGLKALMYVDLECLLEEVRMPTLIIHGRDDKVCPAPAADFLMNSLPDARLNIIEGAGHAPFLTQPGAVNNLIEDFIKK